MNRQIIVVGGGPAGMMAAGTAARFGGTVRLFEKKQNIGQKIAFNRQRALQCH